MHWLYASINYFKIDGQSEIDFPKMQKYGELTKCDSEDWFFFRGDYK